MGLAAGINFSLRTVALAGESYQRDQSEQPLRADELLQMFGRAGRRGIDEIGYVLVAGNDIRLHEAHSGHLSRSALVDWSTLLGLMRSAALQGREPFESAVQAQQRLFTSKPIWLGVEASLKSSQMACGLKTDAERARHVRRRIREFRNSQGDWELFRLLQPCPAGSAMTPAGLNDASSRPTSFARMVPALTSSIVAEKLGFGALEIVQEVEGLRLHGRALTVADVLPDERLVLTKWTRRLTGWTRREARAGLWESDLAPLLSRKLSEKKLPVLRYERRGFRMLAILNLAEQPIQCLVDAQGVAIWNPETRDKQPEDCSLCPQADECRGLSAATGVAMLWRRLGLVDARGVPTLRGQVVGVLPQGDGLAVAAALEEEDYPIEQLLYDLADLDAGFRFCGDENRWAGRLAAACHKAYGLQSIPGYLENGVPPRYGSGAEQVVEAAHKNPGSKTRWVRPNLGLGDIDRIIIEWRSFLRQISHASAIDWPRWKALQALAKAVLFETESPTLTDLPPLDYTQTKRIDHRLDLRRTSWR
ncbi:MAG: hypothetical protein FJ405_04340 [Verrucomicrobia bacterium]|nr:hypothetical protein [Verrucomicrobiota bacterium]